MLARPRAALLFLACVFQQGIDDLAQNALLDGVANLAALRHCVAHDLLVCHGLAQVLIDGQVHDEVGRT